MRGVKSDRFLFLVLAAGEVQAGEGNSDLEKAVAARRGQTKLSQLALTLKPVAWAKLETEMPKDLWASPRVEGRGGPHIAGCTDDVH